MNSARLKWLLREKCMTVPELSGKIGVNYSTVYKWLRGMIKPTTENVAKIADELGVTVEYLNDEGEATAMNDDFYNASNLPDPTVAAAIRNADVVPGEVWRTPDGKYLLVVKRHTDRLFSTLRLVGNETGEISVRINGAEFWTNECMLTYAFRSGLNEWVTSIEPNKLSDIMKRIAKAFTFEVTTVTDDLLFTAQTALLQETKAKLQESENDREALIQQVNKDATKIAELQDALMVSKNAPREVDPRASVEAEIYKSLYNELLSKVMKGVCA